ncbi:uncharacterized protein LOC131060884 [Cryptomeria japonica]|uniref:uncharacterized protein LOC131060884 n=1 Tax=Cryptomeria japonica TaxID=3369 RepID=UPI0027DA76F3|nr:uncharacterized protein LOC131060884 [Cryptomeria japonica]
MQVIHIFKTKCGDLETHNMKENLCKAQEKRNDKFNEGDKVRLLDPFDSVVVSIGRIHSLSILHGVNLKGTCNANVNILTVTSNIRLPYEDKIDGVICLKEIGNLRKVAIKIFAENDIVEYVYHVSYCFMQYFEYFERVGNS